MEVNGWKKISRLGRTIAVSNIPVQFPNHSMLTGQLFLYGAGRAAFESPLASTGASPESLSTKKCILVGGMYDGLLSVPYTQQLADACQDASWSLVQAVMSSSYTGFGHGSLKRDCEELQELMRYLIHHRNAHEFCLIGHSTGCQDAVYLLKHAAPDLLERVKIVALQAPVSDREDEATKDGYQEHLTKAQEMVEEGNGQEMMPRNAFFAMERVGLWAPVTAQRLVDLNSKGGEDDFFSSDYTDEELRGRLEHVGQHKLLRLLVATSGADEYIPSHIDKRVLTQRLLAAMNTHCPNDQPVAQSLHLETGTHNLSEAPEEVKRFVDTVAGLMKGTP